MTFAAPPNVALPAATLPTAAPSTPATVPSAATLPTAGPPTLPIFRAAASSNLAKLTTAVLRTAAPPTAAPQTATSRIASEPPTTLPLARQHTVTPASTKFPAATALLSLFLSAAEVHPAPPKSTRLKQFTYSTGWDLLLLKCVLTAKAHVAAHGQATILFEESQKLFVQAAPAGTFEAMSRSGCKSVRDRFKKIVADRRATNRNNDAASGIVEELGEREILLDDLILEIDELEEQRRTERDEKTEAERRLVAAGE